jgi:hypothetical protein
VQPYAAAHRLQDTFCTKVKLRQSLLSSEFDFMVHARWCTADTARTVENYLLHLIRLVGVLQMLAASIDSLNTIRVIDDRDWFQPQLFPSVGPPYNVKFSNS